MLAMTACSSDSKSNANTSSSSSQPQSSSFDQAAAKAEITQAYTTFFNGASTDNELKLQQLEDPEKARAIYTQTAQQNADLLKGTSVAVKDITFTDPGTAQVTFDLILNGNTASPALAGRIGNAVLVNGKWKITTTTFCDISSLGNPAVSSDPACQ
jgi:hypothetical protein